MHSIGNYGGAFVWTAILIVLLICFWATWMWARKWFQSSQESEHPLSTWSLHDLKELKRQGKISEVEFETLRQQAIATYKDKAQSGDQPS